MEKNREKDLSPLNEIKNLGTGHKSFDEDGGLVPPSSLVKKKYCSTGLTLVELLVVIVIITFSLSLCAALGPSLNRAQESANIAKCAYQLKQMGLAMAVYADCYGGDLPWSGGYDPNFKSPFNCPMQYPYNPLTSNCPADSEIHPWLVYRNTWPGVKPDGSLRPLRLACLYEAGIISDPKIFYCPSETHPLYLYESYTNPMPPNDSNEWGTLPQEINAQGNQYVRTGYTYYPTDPTIPLNSLWQAPAYTARKYGKMDDTIPYLTDRIWKRDEPAGAPWEELIKYPKPFSHRLGGLYSVNALFKDGHIFYCKNQDVFGDDTNPVWLQFECGSAAYQTFFYKTYQAIGRCSRGEDPWP
ncbi:MAG: type II secretion system protein [Sedimentisphaerales bacterium]|nr:type II secretion system protein [Sedimentisphaerales bacterium]